MDSNIPAITIELGGFASRPWLRIGSDRFFVEDGVLRRHGFDDYRLTDALYRVIVALADSRKRGEQELCAELLAQRVGSTASRVRSLLARALRKQSKEPREDLIVYPVTESASGGRRGGRGVGPYQLNLPARRISLDLDEASSFLRGEKVRELVIDTDPFAVLQQASKLAEGGAFSKGISLIRASLREVKSGANSTFSDVADKEVFEANALQNISNLQMELGSWEEGLVSARRALALYGSKKHGQRRRFRHPEQQAQVLLVKAHLFGQAGGKINNDLALWAARSALSVIENSGQPESRGGMARAHLRGVLGQRFSHAGKFHEAVKHLLRARTVAREGGASRWEAIWSIRIAQNAVLLGDTKTAEIELRHAIDLADQMTVAGNAALCRAQAEFFLATQSWNAAEEALLKAETFGVRFGMEHQKKQVEKLWAALRRASKR